VWDRHGAGRGPLMAHSCPECGQVCYCGGDIDDCCFENTPEQLHCQHCPFDCCEDDDYPYDEDDPQDLEGDGK
jgi:hypothetical protein